MTHKKTTSLLTLFTLFVGSLYFLPQKVWAITNPVIGDLGNDAEAAASGEVTLNYFAYLWSAAVSLGGLAVIFFYIWGAFDWITSNGDSGKLDKARQKMIHATIGLIILVSAFTIASYIGQIAFGDQFNIMELTFPTYESSI